VKAKYKITVKGSVQGVGYRYFCYRKAKEYSVKGYAKNNFNGNVDLVVEGEKGLLSDFINDLKIGPANAYVNSVSVEELEFNNEFLDFTIS